MLRKALVLLVVFSFALTATAATPNIVRQEHAQSGVVILALGSVSGHSLFEADEEEDAQAVEESAFHDPLAKTQFEIATAAAAHSQVVILVPDSRSKTKVIERCGTFNKLCDYLERRLIRIEVVSHEGPWIRDYGPMFGTAEGKPVVLDARYFDIRAEARKRAELDQIHHARIFFAERLRKERMLEELKATLQDDFAARLIQSLDDEAPEAAAPESATPETDAGKSSAPQSKPETDSVQAPADDEPLEPVTASGGTESAATDDEEAQAEAFIRALLGDKETSRVAIQKTATERELEFYDHLADAYEHVNTNRTTDDDAPYGVALSIMKSTEFDVARPDLNLDGGNLLRAEDGLCFTTRALLVRNRGKETDVTNLLETSYGCRKVAYLEALRGPVIEHVDMFLLPGAGKRLFLASYDPADPLLAAHWSEMRPVERRLTEEAAVAMKRNEKYLTSLGYEVITVPSPLPRVFEGDLYYPTVLNALIQLSDATGKPNLIVPKYERYQEDIQEQARKTIIEKFGRPVTMDAIESTVAATRQGAVHCLTAVAPADIAIFADKDLADLEQRVQIASADAIRSRTPAGNDAQIEGEWRVADSESGDKRRIVIRNQRVEMRTGDETSLSFGYKIAARDGKKWQLQLDDDDEIWDVAVDWLDSKHVRMTFDENTVLTLQRD